MKIEINNTATVKSEASALIEHSIGLDSVAESIESAIEELKQYWEITQDDASWFYDTLKQKATDLRDIVGCNKNFANVIINYAEKQEKTSQNTIN